MAAEQVVADAPYQIRAGDLQSEEVTPAIARKLRPCRVDVEGQLPLFRGASEGGHNERVVKPVIRMRSINPTYFRMG